MSQTLMLKALGLFTNVNELSEAKPGSMLVADNVVISRDSVVEPRRGFDKLSYKFTSLSDRARNLFTYQDQLLAHYGTDTMAYYDPTAVTQTGDIVVSSFNVINLLSTTNLTVGQTVIANEWTDVTTVADVAGSLNNKYFLMASANNVTQYYVWFNVSSGGTDPSLSNKDGIEVTISTGATANAVATALQTAVNASVAFDASVLSNVVTVKLAAAGKADILRDGPITKTTGFSFTALGSGIPEGTNISAILSSTSVTMSNAATLNRTGSVIAAAGWRNYNGSYTEPDPAMGRIRGTSSNQNFYFVSAEGIKKLDAYNSSITNAGGIKAIDGTGVLIGSSGFMPDDTQVAYRIVWGKKDANNNLILGVPSQRILVPNSSGGSRDVQLTIFIPDGVTVDDFYQIYRSGQSADASTEPNDEMNLVFEDNPTSAELSAGEVIVTDNTPESLRSGATLYTSASQEGILQANEIPPFAKDIAVFKDSVFYGNTRTKQSLLLTNLAVGGADGLNYVVQNATYVNSTSFTVADATGIAAGMSITGPGANIPAGLTVLSVASTTITVTGGTLTSWGATISLQFRDILTIAGVSYIANDLNRSKSIVTITIASPGVVTWTANGLTNGSTVKFTTTGALPTGIVAGTTYYIVNQATNSFQISATQGGTAINTTGSQSGVHTAVANDAKFEIVTGGTPAQNINDTINNLIFVMNQTALNTTVYGYYLSNFDELPGQFLVEERRIGGSVFYATISSHGTAWNPVLQTSGTSISSTNDSFLNGLYFSKTLQPEAVPPLNYLRIGSADEPILRIIPLRDALFVLKSDGVYRITGTDPSNFQPSLLDNTTNLIAPETAAPLSNQIYCFSDQGIAAISDQGVQVVSRPIENILLRLLSSDLTGVAKYSFAVPYETEREYICFTISEAEDTVPNQAFVLNTFTNAWTRWPLTKKCGILNKANGRLYLGDGDSNDVNVERKARDYTDYVDDEFTTTLTSASGKTLIVVNPSNIEEGDLIFQSVTAVTTVASVDATTGTITVEDTLDWIPNNEVTILKAIESIIEFVPQTGKNPGLTKQYREAAFFFKDVFFSKVNVGFTTDLSGNRETVEFVGFGVGLWGLFAWGDGPWGGGQRALSLRTYVPASKQRCSQLTVRLTHKEGYAYYSLEGLSLIFNPNSERLRK